MPIDSGLLTERITLQRLNEQTDIWEEVAPMVPAGFEALGDASYRFLIRYRADLRSKADIAPAMRVIYHFAGQDEALDLTDVIESERRVATQLIASRRIIEDIDDLKTGTKGIKAWP
jgi:hypothetical protein